MENENVASQPEGQAPEQSFTDNEGNITAEALASVGMFAGDDLEAEPQAPPEKVPDTTEQQPEPPKKEEPPPELSTKRKIKRHGQDIEIDPSQEDSLISMGYDYTQKMQSLAAERDMITPYVGVVKAMQTDPVLAKKIAEHLSGTPEQPQKQQFDDPIEQLKWETKQEALTEIRKEMQAQFAPLHRQSALQQVKSQVQADPDYQAVHNAIIEMVNGLPPAIQKTTFLQLDQDPKAYLETFADMKARIKTTPPAKQPDATTPTPVKREAKAPLLETPGTAPSESGESAAMNTRLKALNKKARNGDRHALGELLLLSGQIKGIID
jgi:hypothetical protein